MRKQLATDAITRLFIKRRRIESLFLKATSDIPWLWMT